MKKYHKSWQDNLENCLSLKISDKKFEIIEEIMFRLSIFAGTGAIVTGIVCYILGV